MIDEYTLTEWVLAGMKGSNLTVHELHRWHARTATNIGMSTFPYYQLMHEFATLESQGLIVAVRMKPCSACTDYLDNNPMEQGYELTEKGRAIAVPRRRG